MSVVIFRKSSWYLILICSCPIKSIFNILKLYKKYTWLNPFIIHGIKEFLLSKIFSVWKPIWFYYSTAMLCVTTKAALVFFWKYNISFLINNKVLTFSIYVRHSTVACCIIMTIRFISSLSLVYSIKEKLSINGIWFSIFYKGFIIRYGEWWAPNWRFWITKYGKRNVKEG